MQKHPVTKKDHHSLGSHGHFHNLVATNVDG